MDLWADRQFRLIVFLAFNLYVLLGVSGLIWLSDDFDEFRMMFFKLLGFPLLMVFYCLWFFYPKVVHHHKPAIFILMLANVLSLSWGAGIMLDYLAGRRSPQILLGEGVFPHKRGLSGNFYKVRW